ncbi:MAG TPA: DNA-3-methyladenine glycosidase [Atlantibacter hermannii]|nr:DNA-3-methyladenine glycosidase [Enterobacteriaceae bacterium]HAP80045.1 DNA-3-methyladenine glycosidase [Enterobacteriaceae bacterium]HCC12807.1 DNA-3-methyladenine glycosidase [Atlantibacter hermannii]
MPVKKGGDFSRMWRWHQTEYDSKAEKHKSG